jgi:hypothetical protein
MLRLMALCMVAAAFALLSCSSTKKGTRDQRFGGNDPADSLFFSLERTPCFGRCPAYLVKVYRSGRATLDGRSNAPLNGAHRARVGKEIMERILSEAERIDFFALQDSYDSQVTDLPSTIVRVVSGTRDKQVVGRHRMPETFKGFAQLADSLLLPLPWTPTGQ